ncbi:hypothetical protein ACWKSP_26685, partial [Micromonosporaceae bacterium Da 78-11]
GQRRGDVGMNSREHLADDLDTLITRTKQIGYVAWTVAILVMIFGTPIVYGFLTDHQIPGKVAWMLSLAADGALIVGLIATPVLAQLEVSAGWVGTLRYVAGFSTWALQTAGSWTAKSGPDGVGIAAHSFGPVLLFFAVEAASSFQRKVAGALTAKNRELEAAEQKDADRRAHLAETEAKLRAAEAEVAALTSERDGNLREIENLRAEAASATTRLTAAEGTVGDLQAKLDDTSARLGEESSTAKLRTSEVTSLTARVTELEASEKALREHYETRLRDNAKDHAEALRKAKADARLTHLEDRRRDRAGGATKASSTKTRTRAAFDDEEAVQRLLEAPSDPAKNLPSGDLREWSQQAIVDTLRVGWERSKRLVEAVAEEQRRRASEDASEARAVNE